MSNSTLYLSSKSPNRDFFDKFVAHKGAVVGSIVFAVILVVVMVGPWVHTIDPQFIDIRVKNQGASWDHPMGTDNLGRDTLAQVLAGGRVSMAVGFVAMVLSVLIGTLIGTLAGYYRALDGWLMRLTDLFLALPLLPLLLVAVMLFRDSLRMLFGPEAGLYWRELLRL